MKRKYCTYVETLVETNDLLKIYIDIITFAT